jgi:hypothetical protein
MIWSCTGRSSLPLGYDHRVHIFHHTTSLRGPVHSLELFEKVCKQDGGKMWKIQSPYFTRSFCSS